MNYSVTLARASLFCVLWHVTVLPCLSFPSCEIPVHPPEWGGFIVQYQRLCRGVLKQMQEGSPALGVCSTT